MKKEIAEIKKRGKLVAFCTGWQYWVKDGIVYSISSDGNSLNIWGAASNLGVHLHGLYQVTGKKFFTENSDMMVIDRQFLSQYAYA